MRAAAVAVVLGMGTLAGCLGQGQQLESQGLVEQLSAPVFEGLLKEPLETLAPDGKRLDTFVYRPETPDGVRVPALVYFSPYYSNGGSASATSNQDEFKSHFHGEVIDFFVPRGYAVVHSAVRGTGYSEGCFTIGGPTESKDMVAVIEEIVAQPWSSGSVAVLGKSYVGTTANDVLTEGHEAVKTIVPISAISDGYRYSYQNGVAYSHGRAFNLYYEEGVAIVPPHADPDMETVHLAREETTCTHVENQLPGAESAVTGDKGPYWQVRDYNEQTGRVRAPVFLVHGLQDWNVKPDHILPWAELLREKVPVKMWLGQWFHDYPNHNRYKEEWSRADWNVTLLRWFDHWLKGIDTGILQEPLVDVQDDSGIWRTEADWPPLRAEQQAFHLADGKLAEARAEGRTEWMDTGMHIPAPPQEGAQHYALFVTEPLAEPLRIAGQGHVQLRLEHSARSGTVALTLWDLAPDGEARRINWGFFDLQHRNGLEQSQAVEPGQAFDLDVPLYPQDDVVPAGHRLALTLSGNDPPCQEPGMDLPVVPVGGGPLGLVCGGEPDPRPEALPVPSGGTTAVLHAESRLVLPIVRDILPLDPQPPAEPAGAEP